MNEKTKHFFVSEKKQNINFIEILFTEYKVLNPDYTDIFKKFEVIKEGIAFYNPNKTITSAAHQLLNTLHQTTRDEVIDNKKLANSERLANFLYSYQAMVNDKNKDYSCLLKNKSKYFLSIKMDNFYNGNNNEVYLKNLDNLGISQQIPLKLTIPGRTCHKIEVYEIYEKHYEFKENLKK